MATSLASLVDMLTGLLGGGPGSDAAGFDTGAAAVAYVNDQPGALAEAGVTDINVTAEQFAEALTEAMAQCDLTPVVQANLEAYLAGNPPPVGPASDNGETGALGTPPSPAPAGDAYTMPELARQVEYVTVVAQEQNPTVIQEITNITQEITEIDNSVNVDLEVEGDFEGDFELDVTNVNATGDGAVAAGDDVENAQTGDGGVLIDGDNRGGIATGDGAVATGQGGDIDAVNTGEFTGVQAGGNADVENAIVGDNNQAVQADGDVEDSNINFGDGDITDLRDADIDDSAVSIGSSGDTSNVSDLDDSAVSTGSGDSSNVSDIDLDDSALATGGGDANATDIDTDIEIETEVDVEVEAEQAAVGTAVGESEVELEEVEQLAEEFEGVED